MTTRPLENTHALEAEVYDGSATVTAVWLGRRSIVGIRTGARLTITGRLGIRAGERVIYNPSYVLAK